MTNVFTGGPTPTKLHTATVGSRVAGLMPELEYEIGKMIEGVQHKVFQEIQLGTLDGSKALNYWLETYSYSRLLKRFQTRVSLGESAGEEIAPGMVITKE